MRTFTIKSTELLDNMYEDEDGEVSIACISVAVEVEIEDNIFMLDYQTTLTHDNGAMSSKLESSDEAQADHQKLVAYIDDCVESDALFEAIKEESCAQELWDDHVKENYVQNEDHFGGMDANSEFPMARRA